MESISLEEQTHGAGLSRSGSGTAAPLGITRQWGDRLGVAVLAASTNALHGPLLDFALDPCRRSTLELYRLRECPLSNRIVDTAARLSANRHYLLQPDEPNIRTVARGATFDDDVSRLLLHVCFQFSL